MDIAFTHNLKQSDAEEQAEFDTAETVEAIRAALTRLGHQVDLVEVSGPPSRVLARLEALSPDLVFNTAEGDAGRYREGFYPGVFDELGLPFTGSDAYVCTLTLDKHLTKRVASDGGVPVPRSRLVLAEADLDGAELAFPVLVKPNFEGSSKGVTQDSVAEDAAALAGKVRAALARYPAGLLVEEFVAGRDVTVPFIEGVEANPEGVLGAVEYLFAPEAMRTRRYAIYDYALKNRESDFVSVRCPAKLAPETEARLLELSARLRRLLGIRDFGRFDFRVTPGGEVFFIEANALPSLEPGAGIYAAARRAGLRQTHDALEAIVASALRRRGLPQWRPAGGPPKPRLRVGFTYNVKRNPPSADPATDAEAEFDAPKTLDAIRGAINSYGHEVVDLEANPDLPARLAAAGVDFVFNVAEGIRGRSREAQVPAILDLLDIPYTGSDAATLALAHDKGLAKRILRAEGVPTPPFAVLTTGKERLPKELSFPLLVKPAAEGSSKGVTAAGVVEDENALRNAARELIERYGQAALVEEFLPGREFTVALLGENRPRVLPPMEIVFSPEAGARPVYAYETKLEPNRLISYQAPAEVTPALRRELERVARRVFMGLDCRDVARVDLRLDAQGRVYFLECNPLPGLTPGWSDLCLIAESANMDYRTLIGEILAGAVRRYKEKKRLLMKRAAERDDPPGTRNDPQPQAAPAAPAAGAGD